jgi:ATP-dependent helicase/nuclease subunit A
MIHGLLERLPDVAPERRAEAARTWLKRHGAGPEEADAFAREALKVIADFATLFGAASRAEAPIVGEVEGKAVRGVVDRLAIDDESVMVLDFKTDRPAPANPENTPEAYVLQLALYRAVLRKIFPQKAVSCALLWTEAPRLMIVPQALLDAALHRFARG